MTNHHVRTDRPVVRPMHIEDIGLLTVAVIIALCVITGLAGQAAAWITGRGWPRWRGLGFRIVEPILGVYSHPSDPMRGWPGLPASTPPPLVFWVVYTVLAALLIAIAFAVVRGSRRARGRPGFANRAEVADRLGAAALIKQAARLRPQLTRTHIRPRALQLGSPLGRDVHTGIDCYSSVRQSKFVVGPSESGKTSCVVIPEALDHDGPLLAPSSRADVMAATWKTRAKVGPVMLFDPLRQAPALPLLRWDPVRACADAAVAIRRAQALMASVDMSGVSNGDAWKNRGQAVLRNLLHAAAVGHKDISAVLKWIYDPTNVEPVSILRRSPTSPPNWADEQEQAGNAPDRQRAGIYMAVEGAAAMFAHPDVLHTCLPTAGTHFDPASFLDSSDGHPTMYLLSQRAEAIAVADLLGALMDDVITAARTTAQRQENNRLDPPLRLLADEAPNTTTLKSLPDLISDGGGRGIPTTVVVQDRAQATARWGRDDAASMWGAATVRMVLPGVSGHDELREIAAYADEYDEETSSYGHSGAMGRSHQYQLRPRQALTPAMVRGLPPQHALIIAAGGLPPVMTKLIPYYRRSDAKTSTASEREFYAALNDHRTVQ